MALDIMRFDRPMRDPESKIIWSHPFSNEQFFRNVWEPAIKAHGLKLIKDYGTFTPEQVDDALDELRILLKWCDDNLEGRDRHYMHNRIEDLIRVIPEAALESNEPFHIF